MKTNKTIEELIKKLEGTLTIEQRAKAYSKTQAIECYAYCGYEMGAIEQRQIDIDNCVKWCEKFNRDFCSLGKFSIGN